MFHKDRWDYSYTMKRGHNAMQVKRVTLWFKDDALVRIEGLEYPVGPGSTIGFALIVNALKCSLAQKLTDMGQPPLVLTSGVLIGADKSAELFERTYDDYRERVKKVYGG
jgi:uncharacterized phosphosugar-binding protein